MTYSRTVKYFGLPILAGERRGARTRCEDAVLSIRGPTDYRLPTTDARGLLPQNRKNSFPTNFEKNRDEDTFNGGVYMDW